MSKSFRVGVIWAGLPLLALVVCLAALLSRPSGRRESPDRQAIDTAPPATTGSPTAPAATPEFIAPTASDPATALLIARLFDESLPLNARRQAAAVLARVGSDEAVAALRTCLAQGPPYLKATIAESLGECTNGMAGILLADLAAHPDEIVARGAARGLAARGDAAAAERLGSLLSDPGAPLSVRTEAALALGDIKLPAALEILARSVTELNEPEVVESVLDGIGKRPFAETEDFIRAYVASDGVSMELRAAAIEALGSAEGNVAPFLLSLLSHPEPELRAAAAWALVSVDAGDVGVQLAEFLKSEPDTTVRTRLYQALEARGPSQAGAVLAVVLAESDPAARMAGLQFLAGSLRNYPDPALLDFFTQRAIPELKHAALVSVDAQSRLSSVMVLARAGGAATQALQEIARQSSDGRVVKAAQQALNPPRR